LPGEEKRERAARRHVVVGEREQVGHGPSDQVHFFVQRPRESVADIGQAARTIRRPEPALIEIFERLQERDGVTPVEGGSVASCGAMRT
jgi:hypothetical protein